MNVIVSFAERMFFKTSAPCQKLGFPLFHIPDALLMSSISPFSGTEFRASGRRGYPIKDER